MVEEQQKDGGVTKVRVGYQHLGRIMDIDEIAQHMVGKVIEECLVTFGEDTITLYLSDGSSIEFVIDSIYADIPGLDD